MISSIPSILGYATNISSQDLLVYTNNERAEYGLPSLTMNPALSKAAESKANDMFVYDYWAHTSPSGKEPWDFIVASGYDYLYAGENLAVDFAESKSVVNAWDQSPSHKANLINDNYSEVGFAVVNGELEGRKTTLVVQMFGYPRNQLARVPVEKTNSASIAPPEIVPEVIEEPGIVLDDTPELASAKLIPQPEGAVLNSSDVFNVSRYLAILLGLFLTIMFAVDGYYVRRFGVLRVSGHTFLHLVLLVLAIIGIWYSSIGLVL